MNSITTLRSTALSLAAAVTLVMLAGMNLLASQPHADRLAQSAAPASMQVVVVEGRREARS